MNKPSDSSGTEGMLQPYRILDLTDEKGLICGRLLGDLGADVIKIEKPGGDSARNIGPFYHNEVDPEKSLFWFALNFNKRGITLNIETPEGQEIFKRLAKTTHAVVESFKPGYLDRLGLGYSDLVRINPGIIVTSITPFGLNGPYKDYEASDIAIWALGGAAYPAGDDDRAPVHISHHSQAYYLGASEGAAGTMIALYYKEIIGEGQHVDVSMQRCVEWASHRSHEAWDLNREIIRRTGTKYKAQGSVSLKRVWPCRDGNVAFYLFGGVMGSRSNIPLMEWIASEGFSVGSLKSVDWANLDWNNETQDFADQVEGLIGKFFMAHTKKELFQGSLDRGIAIYPVATMQDIFEYPQLEARKYWVELEHPELGGTITYPGAWLNASETPFVLKRRAPLVGEHNSEIYKLELGFSEEEISKLKQRGVI